MSNASVTDRTAWLREKRSRCEQRMDTLFAPEYDQHWGHINATHQHMLERFLALCPPDARILDAACGTGKYWPLMLDGSRTIQGMDQSSGMLAKAHAKYPGVPIEKLGMQDIAYDAAFDGIICMDAMENIFPEDWPLVLRNFHRALKLSAPLYFTVELAASDEITAAYDAGLRMGLPLVEGEWAHEGGYHYYPLLERVREWTRDAGFTLLDEAEGDGYAHYLTRKAQ